MWADVAKSQCHINPKVLFYCYEWQCLDFLKSMGMLIAVFFNVCCACCSTASALCCNSSKKDW